jgi:hypothetical protein
MIELLLALTSIPPQEQVNRQCAYIVGIPYASDNFTQEEWNRFQLCRELIDKKSS